MYACVSCTYVRMFFDNAASIPLFTEKTIKYDNVCDIYETTIATHYAVMTTVDEDDELVNVANLPKTPAPPCGVFFLGSRGDVPLLTHRSPCRVSFC